MNPSSRRMKSFIQSKLFLIFILGLMLIVPMAVAAQESTEEPQDDPVVTEQPVEQPTEVEETVAPTEVPVEETIAPTEVTEVAPEETVSTPVPEATVEEADVSEEPTEDVLVESTEETDPLAESTEEVVDETPAATEESPIETPAEITEISEDFEAWTGDGWSVEDWTVEQVDDSLALVSTVANAYAAVDSLDWTNYTVEVDVKVEAGNTLNIAFADYTLVMATDGRNRLSQNDTVIATSPTVEVTSDEPTWHTIHINKAGSTLTITVEDIAQYTVETTDSPIGIFAFMPSADKGVAVDNLVMAEVDEADVVEIISTPTPESEVIDVIAEVTEDPMAEATEDPLAEATEDPMAEATEDPLAEATEDPMAEATEDPLAEATEEPAVDVVEEPTTVVTNLISDDFEGDLAAWNTTASIVEVAEGNHALLLSDSGQLAPAMTIESSHVIFSGEANILSDVENAGKFTVAFGTYTIDISTTGVTISDNGEVVAATESAIGASVWFNYTIEANTDGIIVTINDAVVAEYAGELALDGNFTVTTNTSVMLDNVSVDTIDELTDPLATPTPEALTEETQSKLRGAAEDMMNAYLESGEEGVAEFLLNTTDETDEFGRILVNILAEGDATGDAIAQIVTDAGGEVTRIHTGSAEAFVDVQILLALVNNENVRVIRNINRATSTGPVGNNGLSGEDYYETWTEGYNLLSAHEWHLAGVTGQDVKVGVIDVGFADADNATQRNGNLSCLASTTPSYEPPLDPGLGTSTHGTEMVEVICDMAPDADVYMFRADSVESVRDAVSAARNPTNRMDVLVIALDLGVNTSAGDGQSGDVDLNVYGEIQAAKNSGMVIVAAAGNNNKRTLVLRLSTGDPGETTIDILGTSNGDVIKFGWNDFDGNGSSIATISANVPGDSDSTNDPQDGMYITSSGGDIELAINPSGVIETTYLQVQIVPADAGSSVQFDYDSLAVGSSTIDITNDDGVGNLGRPADSDSVISVGAICTRINDNPTRWEFSSNGPRFDAGGEPFAFSGSHVTQDEAKPTLMSYSFVSTSDLFSAPEGEDPVDGLLSCTDGFGGTSSAAAHVAGMTALIMSNDSNDSFAAMNEANATSASTFTKIRNYLQARSVDLPLGAEANGYDTDFGSGLAILGAPTYDLDNTVNRSTAANQLPENCDVTNTLYVGQAAMDDATLSGDINTPLISIAEAMNTLVPVYNNVPECIIVMPGEYVSPIFVESSYTDPLLVTGYSDVNRTDVGDVIYWMRAFYSSTDPQEYTYASYAVDQEPTYRRRAGLYFGETSSNVEFSGLTFVPARYYTDASGIDNTSSLSAVVMDGSTDTAVSNSQFGKLTLNGVTYPGWYNINATPIQVLNEAVGSRIENNIFNENSVNTANFYPTVAIIHSGAEDNPVVVKGNEIFGNYATILDQSEWSAILYAEGSYIDIINNAIYENEGGTIIKVATTNPRNDALALADATHERRARIVGNVFLHNTTLSDQLQKQPGALINARFAPMMYIINNTIVGNTITNNGNGFFGQLFSRGNANSESGDGDYSTAGSLPDGWAFWEIHNNLIYNNTYYELVGDTSGITHLCSRIPNDSSHSFGGVPADGLNAFAWDDFEGSFQIPYDISGTFNQRGAQNNWIVSNVASSGSEFGDCQIAIEKDKTTDTNSFAYINHNMTETELQPVHIKSTDDSAAAQVGDFQGQDPTIDPPIYTTSDWQYYAIGDTFISADNPSLNEYSDGVDAGGDQWLTDTGGGDTGDLYMDNADISLDIAGTARPLDVRDWEFSWYPTTPPRGISSTDTETYLIDIGAFEYSPLQFETQETYDYYNADETIDIGSVTLPAVTADLKEDLEDWGADYVTFDLSTVVTGGFGDLTFSILQDPNNYGTQCGDQFENTRGLVIRGDGFDEIFDYCPPANFYTNDSDSFDNNDYISFQVRVEDEAGAFAIGEVRFTIDPDEGGTGDDSDFGETSGVIIGNGQDRDTTPNENDTFEVVTTLGQTINVRLRPYVRFGNFFFSENSNPEFITDDGRKLVDYPFTYSNFAIVNSAESDPDIIESYDTSGFPNSPVITLSTSVSQTGTVQITYTVTDQKGGVSNGNILTVRSVSIIPDSGLHDDTSFIWNYSDSENAPFYTEADGYDTAEAPESGDWEALRDVEAINQTLHTTSTVDDVATFRLIGTGFTIFMRGGSATAGQPFTFKVFDDLDSDVSEYKDFERDIFSMADSATWVSGTANINKLEINLNNLDDEGTPISEDVDGTGTVDYFTCTTRAGTDPLDSTQLVHSLESYTITCDGLPARTHSVQIINTGGGTLSVDAFSIINGGLVFDDSGPIPPGFHDADNGLLQYAFSDSGIGWTEVVDSTYSNSFAMQAAGSGELSFQITDATGLSVGTSYLNDNLSFELCVKEESQSGDGICTLVQETISSTDVESQIHIPFYGLNPGYVYDVTVKDISSGFIFDDLVVYDELLAPLANLPLGETYASSLDLILGEPFGDDWEISDSVRVINEDRSSVGPFITFQMDDDIDTIGIKVDNPAPPVICPKKGPCPEPDPSGLSGLMVCVNRGIGAEDSINDYGKCVILDTNVPSTDYISNTDGSLQSGTPVNYEDGIIYVPESIFALGDWGDNGNNTVEIFNLYPAKNLEFTSIVLFSSEAGLGAGTYTSNSTSFSYVQFDHDTGGYNNVTIDDASGAFVNSVITECVSYKKGVCIEEEVTGTLLQTTGVGNAIIFEMTGTGLQPQFTASENSFARVCIANNSDISDQSSAAASAPEIQAKGYCQDVDLSQDVPFIQGIEASVQYVMIELLPNSVGETETCVTVKQTIVCTTTTYPPTMNFTGVKITDVDWESLDSLESGERYESAYTNRANTNEFAYIGSWETKEDTDNDHSGSEYDETDGDINAGVIFKVTGSNTIHIIRDLSTEVEPVCDKKGRDCTEGSDGFSDIKVCVAPLSEPSNQKCSQYSSSGDETGSILSISLNDDFDTDDYVVSIMTIDDEGFVFDAVEAFDTTSDTMTAGTYQESSELIAYTMGQQDILKNTSFEIDNGFLDYPGEYWDWSIITGVSGSITKEDSFIGARSAKIDADENEGLVSEQVYLKSGVRYTVVARVNVTAGSVAMDMGNIPEISNIYNDKWELLRYSFEATSDGTDQIQFIAKSDNTTFFVDDVHIYEEGTWDITNGDVADGQLMTSVGHGGKASFIFTGTGFTVKLDSDETSGETRVCYDDDVVNFGSPTCFTYDNQREAGETVCTGSKKDIVCTTTISSINNGHTVVGLPSDDYKVTIEQMDNGLSTLEGAPVCTAYKKGSCITYVDGAPANSPSDYIASVKLDYVRIYNKTVTLPLVDTGIYNENALISGSLGLQLFPADEWSQQVANSEEGFTDDSYYQSDEGVMGSQFALKVDNSEPVTVIIDINQANEDATNVLACTNSIEGVMSFNGTDYDSTALTSCVVTNDATQKTQLAFNKDNLPNLDGSGGETILYIQSVNGSQFVIDGYQVIHGTTLTAGFYEENVGYGTLDSILNVTNVSGTDDWKSLINEAYSGNAALQTTVSGTTVTFEFEGTGVSMLMGVGDSTTTCLSYKKGVCNLYETTSKPLGKIDINLESAAICGGSCNSLLDTTDSLTEMQLVPGPYTIAGLPEGTYTVTITTHLDTTLEEEFVLDAIEVFGELQQLGSLYDDSQVDIDANLLLTYSPSNSVWSAALPNANGEFLNNTYHYTTANNATVSFEVGADMATEAIILYDGNPALPDPVCVQSGRSIVCEDVPFTVPSSSSIEVCWSDLDNPTPLDRTCETYTNFDDGVSARRIDAPLAGHYSVSISNKASGEPLYIDAIQVIEEGLMTEGIFEEDYFDSYTAITNTGAANDLVIALNNGQQAEFTFEGVAFAIQLVESSTSFDVCAYAGNSGDGNCTDDDVLDALDPPIAPVSGTLSSVTYGGFHDVSGANGTWTVVVTNTDAANALLIDRVDILGNNSSLMISDKKNHEAGEPEIRYLPFGSWTENSDFKDDDVPSNNSRFETTTQGSFAYFEFDEADVGIEYIRQIQDYQAESQVCTAYKGDNCKSYATVPPVPAYAPAKICVGEIGNRASIDCDISFPNGSNNEINEGLSVFEFSSSTDVPISLDCATQGCWASIEYTRGSADSLTPLDYIRLYDPASSLTEGVYQETHPNIHDISDHEAVTVESIADENARVGFYDLISGTSGESYFYFPFQGTGLSVRMLATENAEDVYICLIDYPDELTPPTIPADIPADEDCVNKFDNQQEEDGYVTRVVHGLDSEANYMAIIKMNSSDGSTVMGLDQVTIFDTPWYNRDDLNDDEYLNLLTGGDAFQIDFKSRNTDKYVQFLGNWQSVSEQILVGYGNEKKKLNPIYITEEGDRGFNSGAAILFRTDGANAVTIDIESEDTAHFQVCALPLVEDTVWTTDVSSKATCKTFTQTGRSNQSFVFSDTSTPHVIVLQLLDNDNWMSIYNLWVLDVTSGLGAGKYDDTAPGIEFDLDYEAILEESMEDPTDGSEADEDDDNLGWDKIGSSTQIDRAGRTAVCVEGKRGLTCTYEPEPTLEVCVEGKSGLTCTYEAEPTLEVCVQGKKGVTCSSEYQSSYDGSYTRKVVANIGQGIEYLGDGSGIALENDTYYTLTAHVFINADAVGGVAMKLVDGTEVISELDSLDLSTTTRGAWQTLRATFKTTSDYSNLSLQLVAIDGQTTFFVDGVSIITGGTWESTSPPLGPDVCTGSGKKLTCVEGDPVFEAYNNNISQSTTPGASFTFEFSGTGFELGLLGGNTTGEVEVCYSNETDFANPTCFNYSQDDGAPAEIETCISYRKDTCKETAIGENDTATIAGRGIAGLPDDLWTVVVRSVDDGYSLDDPDKSRFDGSAYVEALFALDYINIFGNDSIPPVSPGSYNEDAVNGSDVSYLGLYPENDWTSFPGSSKFTSKTYVAPIDGTTASTTPGPVAMLNVNVPEDDADIAIAFQFGGDATEFSDSLLLCVDETKGTIGWDGSQYTLSDSDSCIIVNEAGSVGQATITSDDVNALQTMGEHTVTITALSNGNFRIDAYQIFNGRALVSGLHNESLPSTILDYGPEGLNTGSDCDETSDWCYTKSKATLEDVCVRYKSGVCKTYELQTVETTPYIGGAAITAQSGATLNFVAEGTGFSIITDVDDNGMDFRVCYKLESSDTSFPVHTTPIVGDELIAVNGFEIDDEGNGLPILVSEGGILCENLTTDTDNWDEVMPNRVLSSGAQYGYSFYGLPYNTYEVQIMVTTPENEIEADDWFTIDAINVFSNPVDLTPLATGLTDDSSDSISYEPSLFWDSNATSDTYMYSDSTTTHAGAISQFRVDGNTMVLYHSIGEDMTSDAQVCLVISNENIHCTVEAERQTRLARQVTNFTQVGSDVEAIGCISYKKGTCKEYGTVVTPESATFTPVVFYGLGTENVHKVIVENRVQDQTMNIDAIQVIPSSE